MPDTLTEKAYTRLLDPFYRINLTPEEYVLIKMLLFCYYPSTSNLSPHAKEKLQIEYNKTSKLLLKHMQIQYGTQEGVKKYVEGIGLIGTLFHFMERHKEIYVIGRLVRQDRKRLKGKMHTPRWHALMEEIFA